MKTLATLALAAAASLGAVALSAAPAAAGPVGFKVHGHGHHWVGGWHHPRPWGHVVRVGWFPRPVYTSFYGGCTWVRRVRFVPGFGPVVRYRPVCY